MSIIPPRGINPVSVGMPASNEERRILAAVRRIDGYLKDSTGKDGIMAVDDGGPDGTADVASIKKALKVIFPP